MSKTTKRIYFTSPADHDLLAEGLRAALFEAENMIVTCPDPEHYAVELEGYRNKTARLRKLLTRFNVKRTT